MTRAEQRKVKEEAMLAFLSEDERKELEAFEQKVKAKRDEAARRQKAEMQFWKKVDDRKDEVMQRFDVVIDDTATQNLKAVCNMYGCTEEEFWAYVMSARQVDYYKQYHPSTP